MAIHEAIMKFGKYKGQRMSEIPVGYLEWLINKERSEHGFVGERDTRRLDKNNGLFSIPLMVALNHHIQKSHGFGQSSPSQ